MTKNNKIKSTDNVSAKAGRIVFVSLSALIVVLIAAPNPVATAADANITAGSSVVVSATSVPSIRLTPSARMRSASASAVRTVLV